MKGFPNQVANLRTLTSALQIMSDIIEECRNPRDDGVYGEELIRRGILGTGHTPKPVEEYLEEQKRKKISNQSYRTRARGLREEFRILKLISDDGIGISITPAGSEIIAIGSNDITGQYLERWRNVIINMEHDGNDGEYSHPYQVLLRLVAKKHGITRAKCALALEAKNDSDEELDRILDIAQKDEDEIIEIIGVTHTNWNNAKKILPSFAEQLGDVIKIKDKFYLTDAPGSFTDKDRGIGARERRRKRASSAVTSDTIAKACTTEAFDENDYSDITDVSSETRREQIRKTQNRLRRHNQIVQDMARVLESEGATLYENPFDCLAEYADKGLLIEVKTLDGSEADEMRRVRDALAQILYYESFAIKPIVEDKEIVKIACFEGKVSDRHIEWFDSNDIYVIWKDAEGFGADDETKGNLTGYFGF